MTTWTWLGIALICFVLPAVITLAVSEAMIKLKLYKPEDMKLDL